MSFDLNGSLYNQALQVKRTSILAGNKMAPKTQEYKMSFSTAYSNTMDFEEKPKTPEKTKIDFIA